MNIAWDAEKYAQDFSFVPQHGTELLALLEKEKVHTVLDLGCGNGVLTNQLSDAGFSVLGMDASEAQLSLARKNYPHLSFVRGDAASFTLQTPVDAVFSNAVLHWIDRESHPKMLACVFRALKSGGQFVFECGGDGNAEKIHGALRREFEKRHLDYRVSFYFPTVDAYTALLEQAGFTVDSAELFDRPTPLSGEDGLKNWIQMFIKEPFASIAEVQKDEIIAKAIESLRPLLYRDGVWIADYTRLRCKACKPV